MAAVTPDSLAALMGETLAPGLRIGLLGGSFNPAHEGHLHITKEALARLGLDQVWWLVSPQNPLKPAEGMAPIERRLETARDIAQDPAIRVTDLESRLGTQYSADILRELKARGESLRFVWIMGADNFAQLPQWKDWSFMVENVPIAVMARTGFEEMALDREAAGDLAKARIPEEKAATLANCAPPAWVYLPIPLHSGSSTQVREGGKW